ncbi:MAG: YvrJ family protein [Elusimicrobiota bacterium]
MTNLISNVGFPIAIAMYVLIRLEQSLRKNTEAIKELTIKIKSWK